VRRGLAGDWTPVHLPPALPVSVVVFLLSSLFLETGRRRFKAHRAFIGVWFSGAALGLIFVLMQLYAWNQISQSTSAAASPAAAFVYVLTGTFVVLVIGSTAALIWVGVREISFTRLTIAAFYWHCLGALWLYLVILFYLRS
jgi:cytochrome c oxidase subunit III